MPLVSTHPDTKKDAETKLLRKSNRFCSADADVTFRSSDNVLFSVHRKYLEAHAGGFPPPEIKIDDEVVQLTEDSDTLELLFQLTYPNPAPDLESLSFENLMLLAEAAEKYQVYHATNSCQMQIRMLLTKNVVPKKEEMEILKYAVKHDHPKIVNELAPQMIHIPLKEMIEIFPLSTYSSFIGTWVTYVDYWDKIRRLDITPKTYCGLRKCGAWSAGNNNVFFRIIKEVANMETLENVEEVFKREIGNATWQCNCFEKDLECWKTKMIEDMKKIPKFIDLI